ncbi:hypothetical protein BH11ACT5_BH11ACT5_04670 [soil metagenome]
MSSRFAAWTAFALGLVVLIVLGFVTMFFVAQGVTGCGRTFGGGMENPAYCDSEATRSLLLFGPIIAVAVYTVGSIVGIILWGRTRWAPAVPLGLGVLAIASFVVEITTVS